jgi:hypothetical protein
MRNLLVVFLFFLFTRELLFSQTSFGFYGGVNQSRLRITSRDAQPYSIEINSLTGSAFGVFLEHYTNMLWEKLYCYIQPEVRYIQKGVEGSVEPYMGWNLNYIYKYEFIEFPIFYKAKLKFNRFNIYSSWGINVGICIDSRQEVTGIVKPFGYDMVYSEIKDKSITEKIDFCLDSGLGMGYKYNENLELLFEVRYSFGFPDIHKPENEERRSTGLQILLGIQLNKLF